MSAARILRKSSFRRSKRAEPSRYTKDLVFEVLFVVALLWAFWWIGTSLTEYVNTLKGALQQ